MRDKKAGKQWGVEDGSMKIKHPVGLSFLGVCLWLLFWPSEKDHLNKQMAELCKKDGGVRIYKTVTLPPEMYNEFGSLKTPQTIKRGNEYVSQVAGIYELRTETRIIKDGDLHKGEGRLTRDHSLLVNNMDHQILAEGIQYGRAGGDRWSSGMHSIENCPNEPIDLFDKVFSKLETAK